MQFRPIRWLDYLSEVYKKCHHYDLLLLCFFMICLIQRSYVCNPLPELLQVERIKHRDDVGGINRRHRSEVQHHRQGFEESERAYKDRIDRLEDHRRGIEEELSRVKAQQLTERLSLEEQILATKKQVRDEEVKTKSIVHFCVCVCFTCDVTHESRQTVYCNNTWEQSAQFFS